MAKQKICGSCGTIDNPKKHTKGSFLIEVILWLCFILPGLIYSIWRLTSKEVVCRTCKSKYLVPLDSPKGRALRRELATNNKRSDEPSLIALEKYCKSGGYETDAVITGLHNGKIPGRKIDGEWFIVQL